MSIAHNDRIENNRVETIIWQILDNHFPLLILDGLTSNDQMTQFDAFHQPEPSHIRLNKIQYYTRRRIRVGSLREQMVGELHQLIRLIRSV